VNTAKRDRIRQRISQAKFVILENLVYGKNLKFSEATKFAFIRERVFDLVCNGFVPIIAHAERYLTLLSNFDKVDQLIALGAKIQLNANSIIGLDGRKIKKFCATIMREDYLFAVASDSHGTTRRPPYLHRCASYIEKKLGADYACKVLIHNPKDIFLGH